MQSNFSEFTQRYGDPVRFSRDDLHDIVVFISRDNPQRAMAFGYRLISEPDKLQTFPEIGRMIPDTKIRVSARLSFSHTESSIESNMSVRSVRLLDSGIWLEEHRNFETFGSCSRSEQVMLRTF